MKMERQHIALMLGTNFDALEQTILERFRALYGQENVSFFTKLDNASKYLDGRAVDQLVVVYDGENEEVVDTLFARKDLFTNATRKILLVNLESCVHDLERQNFGNDHMLFVSEHDQHDIDVRIRQACDPTDDMPGIPNDLDFVRKPHRDQSAIQTVH